ncbi:lipocalin-like domain-containing protein [Alteromonas gilva]|uniref:Lipocalin-like domain-containing protein n=1 Tax=Alteromonas gilva TaxID=2987522 RepID=A0ABT5L369_9ALTE|nr:lipocalin-like domain-containing protein [Alteromonas gilva]MDC8831481.1 lipocalin-like domain-containing protein [Alteromonas gilva]
MRAMKWLLISLVSGLLIVTGQQGFAYAPPTEAEQQVVVPHRSLFSGMRADKSARVTIDNPVSLPRDHAPHPAYQLEWWYLTFLLEDANGAPFNYQFTLFRLARPEMASNWGAGQIWMGHSSLHTETQHWFSEKFAQQGTGRAGYSSTPFALFMDNWRWQSDTTERFFLAHLQSSAQNARVNLQLHATKPFIRHGDQGVSVKTADGHYRSYYYSQPFIDATGTINIDGKPVKVSGVGWFDHEWTSQLTDEDALGWDWFSLHFDDGRKLMVFTMHANNRAAYSTGTLIGAKGQSSTLSNNDITLTPLKNEQVAGRVLPLQWQIQVANADIDITTTPYKTKQYNHSRFPYYEGAIRFSGSHTGKGFMELTGY